MGKLSLRATSQGRVAKSTGMNWPIGPWFRRAAEIERPERATSRFDLLKLGVRVPDKAVRIRMGSAGITDLLHLASSLDRELFVRL
jgi:hypothetical protein